MTVHTACLKCAAELTELQAQLERLRQESASFRRIAEDNGAVQAAAMVEISKLRAEVATARALAIEEVCISLRYEVKQGRLDLLRALATLSATLVAVPVEKMKMFPIAVEAMKESLGEYVRQSMYTNPEWSNGFAKLDHAVAEITALLEKKL